MYVHLSTLPIIFLNKNCQELNKNMLLRIEFLYIMF